MFLKGWMDEGIACLAFAGKKPCRQQRIQQQVQIVFWQLLRFGNGIQVFADEHSPKAGFAQIARGCGFGESPCECCQKGVAARLEFISLDGCQHSFGFDQWFGSLEFFPAFADGAGVQFRTVRGQDHSTTFNWLRSV